jgi:glycosyltransferase involved in cell wall biosynthesis
MCEFFVVKFFIDITHSLMKVLVTTPYARDSLQGNTVTAKRVVSILLETGLDASVISNDDKVEYADVIIALHARKSAHFIDDFLALNPAGKVIVYLTGTDLYHDIPNGCQICERSMSLADVLVVSHELTLNALPEKYRKKAMSVHKSIQLPDFLGEEKIEIDPNLFTIIGHLRAVKQPFMAVESMQLLEDSVRVKLVLLGNEIDEDSGEIARSWEAIDSRFQWLGGVEYLQALQWMRRSVATINTSLIEGGANSVGESIMLGVPVLATRIEGNIGMLGEDYAGYFSAESKQELADIMQRVISDADFLAMLREQVRVRKKKFTRENEKQDWMNVLKIIS